MSELKITVDRVTELEARCVFINAVGPGYILSGTIITECGSIGLLDCKFLSSKPTKKQLRDFKKTCRERKIVMDANIFIEESRKFLKERESRNVTTH